MDTPGGVNGEAAARGLILVAEDDAGIRTLLARLMSWRGYEVIVAADGLEAVALARGRRPDIVLLDISMPGKSGIEVLGELAPDMPGTGFIMVTGNADEELARRCLELGACDYLPKPMDLDGLADTVEARLRVRPPV